MIANRVKETTTTTGTGSLTLAGAATNFRTFNAVFGASRHFFYWIVDDSNNAWEYGYGYLSDATTLVRETVLSNSSGTTAALALGLGTKTVFSDLGDSLSGVPAIYDDPTHGKCVYSAHYMFGGNTTGANTADIAIYAPFKLEFAGTVTGMRLSINALSLAAAKARLGIYDVAATGLPGAQLATTGDIDGGPTGATGAQVHAVTSLFLTPGWYFVAFATNDATISWHKQLQYLSGQTPLGAYATTVSMNCHAFETLSGGWTALPATAAPTSFGNFNNTFPPAVALQFA